MTTDSIAPISGAAAGVPFLAIPPTRADRATAPLVVAWHLMDAPRTPAAFAAAVPLAGLDAWRVYLTLPLFGDRAPAGGFEEFMRLGLEDAVGLLYEPSIVGAAVEFPATLAALRAELGITAPTLGLLGGSAGSMVARLVLAESDIPVAASVFVSPMAQLRPVIALGEALFGTTYRWTAASDAVADRLDFVARATEVTKRRAGSPILTILGAADDESMVRATEAEHAALVAGAADADRVPLITIPGLGHALADEPGIEAAPQADGAAEVDRLAAGWFRRHLA